MALVVKNPSANGGDIRDRGSIPGWGKIPCRRAWLPTPLFLPRESHGQRSLVGYSPGGCKEMDTAEATEHAHMQMMSKKITYGLKSTSLERRSH